MKHKNLTLIFALLLTACGRGDAEYDATGTFEATEVVVSAEANGRLLMFDVEEGTTLTGGQEVGVIDTMQLYLKRLQLQASLKSVEEQRPDILKQVAATREQITQAERERDRVARLLRVNAANQKQLDDAETMRSLRGLVDARRYRKDFLYMCRRHRENKKAYYETIFQASVFLGSGLSIVPTRNMINNLGAVADSTHFAGSAQTMPRGYRRIFTMKRHEVDFPLKHPRYVVENTAYKERVYRIMGWRHPWIKVARSFEELFLNLRYGNFKLITQAVRRRVDKWLRRDRHW